MVISQRNFNGSYTQVATSRGLRVRIDQDLAWRCFTGVSRGKLPGGQVE